MVLHDALFDRLQRVRMRCTLHRVILVKTSRWSNVTLMRPGRMSQDGMFEPTEGAEDAFEAV